MAIFSPWLSSQCTVFVLSRLYFICCTHIELKSLVRYFCGRLHKISHLILLKHINCHVQYENLVTFLDFRLSQGIVATYCRLGGHLCDMYIKNFLANPCWKNFENRSTFAKVIIKHQEAVFLEHGLDHNFYRQFNSKCIGDDTGS